jgi:hypothetical protein
LTNRQNLREKLQTSLDIYSMQNELQGKGPRRTTGVY